MKSFIYTNLIIFIAFSLSFSQDTHRYSMTAIDLMYDLQQWYQNEKVELFEQHMVSQHDQEDLNRKIEQFFASQTFIETGASYLTSLFSEKELLELRQAVQNGALTETTNNTPQVASVQKLRLLFKKLDPYMYHYLQQKLN